VTHRRVRNGIRLRKGASDPFLRPGVARRTFV
jgi:hypothetical protein